MTMKPRNMRRRRLVADMDARIQIKPETEALQCVLAGAVELRPNEQAIVPH